MTGPAPLARRLLARAPGWTTSADVIVVGSGIAGLTATLRLRQRVDRVLLVTKTVLDEGSTRWAQGGIAAALDPADSPAEHLQDTLVAGAGVCDADAVRVLVTEGPARVRELVSLGTRFDRTADGHLALTREGGHHRNRIAHAGGDATGKEISRALLAALDAVRGDPGIEVVEHAMVVDLLQAADGRVCGVTLHVLGEGQRDGVGAALARAVVLATGGLGQVYSSTTNPSVATGDGVAAALRAGAAVRDLEFVQFHPTVLWLGAGSSGQQPLISEAVRGEGAFLIDASGDRFMTGVHELADLAPRDVVSRAIVDRMQATGADHVYLDARHLGREFLSERFPSIVRRCRELGFDPATEPLPVAPAQHYASGGVVTDLRGPVLAARAVGVRGGGVLRRPRRQPVGVQLAARGPGLRQPHRRRPDRAADRRGAAARRSRSGDRRAWPARHVGPGAGAGGHDGRVGRGALGGVDRQDDRPAHRDLGQHQWGAVGSRLGDDQPVPGRHRAHHRRGAPAGVTRRARAQRLPPARRPRVAWPPDGSARRGWSGDGHLRTGARRVRAGPRRSVRMSESTDVRQVEAPGLDLGRVREVVAVALDEDLGGPAGVDVTASATIPLQHRSTAQVVARADGVVAGLDVFAVVWDDVRRRLGAGAVQVQLLVDDGSSVRRGDVLVEATGPTQVLLTGERTALNLVCRMSGVATHTRRWADVLAGTGATVLDTRKTTPGLRALEKYAVRCGGGTNKRMGLYDVAMVKDNHKLAAGSVRAAYEAVRRAFPPVEVQVEVTTVAEALEAVGAGARFLLCDNMGPRFWVRR